MDTAEFDKVAGQYAGFIFNVALRMMGNSHDAEDVAQEAIISAWKSRDRFRGDSQLTTWLYRITVNAALMRIRKEKRHKERAGGDIFELDMPSTDWTQSPSAWTLNSELRERLNSAISELPPDLRAAVVLRDVQSLTTEQAAQVLEITVPAFKARLHRGRVILRNTLTGYARGHAT